MNEYVVRQACYEGERPNYLVLIADDERTKAQHPAPFLCGEGIRTFEGYGCTWISSLDAATRFVRRSESAALAFARDNVSPSERDDPMRPIEFVTFARAAHEEAST